MEVDRPPLLMAFWREAAALGGVEQARWLVCPLVATLVLAAGWAGWLIGDARGARWSAITVASLAASPLIGTVFLRVSVDRVLPQMTAACGE